MDTKKTKEERPEGLTPDDIRDYAKTMLPNDRFREQIFLHVTSDDHKKWEEFFRKKEDP